MSKLCNKIDPNKIKGVGLIFVRKEDPVNLFVLSITKQLYSLIGFYYKTRVSGQKKIHVILSDICGIVSSKWMNPFTIEDLIHDPLVTQLSIRKLSPVLDEDGYVDKSATKHRYENFKAAIADITSNGPATSTEEWIKQIFGFEICQPGGGSTTVELVNRVIMRTDNWDKIEQNGSMSMEGLIKNQTPPIIPKNSEGKCYIFAKMGSDMKQIKVNQPGVGNKLLQSYLVDNGTFDPIRHIKLPSHTQLQTNLRREQSIAEHKQFLIEAVSTFVRLLMNNTRFFDTVVDGINSNAMMANKMDDNFKISMFNIVQSSHNVVSTIISMIECGRFNFGDLRKIINEHKYKVESTVKMVDININHFPSILECKDKIVILENDRYKSKFDHNLKQFHQQIQDTVKSIKNNETPVLNINALIDNLNTFVRLSGSKLSKVRKVDGNCSYGAVLSINDNKKIPVQFKSGKKIVIPSVGYDLSILNCSEIKELLTTIDVMTKGEDYFDNLGSDLASRLAECESEECLEH
uniref:Uncharacterized protein n=1 Tax=Pithovirus LCPAC001 TaxID=2506585 RepID=A0A481Z1S6_9VIRU|nr:MAG: uncharacterized protein LCPAC001_01900 [Pithovirus LCPAC001]